jgi:NAD(P)H-hydrate epimerase
MAAVTVAEMLAAERAARQAGWSEERLLELAGTRLGRAIGRFFPRSGTAVSYLGKGHNAGDAIVALAVLRDEFGWHTGVRQAFATSEMAPLCGLMLERHAIPPAWTEAPNPADSKNPLLLIDGLVGIGAKGELRDPLRPLVAEMNRLRNEAGAMVGAVDLPSGINPDTGEPGPVQVGADVTFMIANAKAGLLQAGAADATGSLAIVPVEALTTSGSCDLELVQPQALSFGKAPRPCEFHKGMAGRVSIIAGSPAYTGAAVLCAIGCLRAGAGLVTLNVPAGTETAIASRCPPEIIVRARQSLIDAFQSQADSIVVGCGLGSLDEKASRELLAGIDSSDVPMVLDADALNVIAAHGSQHMLRSHHVLTPHPGEFARLFPHLAELPRLDAIRKCRQLIPSTILLKGSRTLVSAPGSPVFHNATGHPGMATGGQGDLLSGVIGALLAAGLPGVNAASFGAWLCGRAAETAIWRAGHSAESLTPSDTALQLGAAFLDWRLASR